MQIAHHYRFYGDLYKESIGDLVEARARYCRKGQGRTRKLEDAIVKAEKGWTELEGLSDMFHLGTTKKGSFTVSCEQERCRLRASFRRSLPGFRSIAALVRTISRPRGG